MKDNYLYNIFIENLCPNDNSNSIYRRNWYVINAFLKKDQGRIVHASRKNHFTIIPEKDKYIFAETSYYNTDIPQTIENYDKKFDKSISKFLNEVQNKFRIKNDYNLIGFNSIRSDKPIMFIDNYIKLDGDDNVSHLEKISSFEVRVRNFDDVNEFLGLLYFGASNPRFRIRSRYNQRIIIERKLETV